MGEDMADAARTGSGDTEQSQILVLLHAQTALLRALTEQIAALLQMLAPGEREGPSLDELIARLIDAIQSQGVTLGRVDAKLTALGTDLPPSIADAVLRERRNRDLAP